MHAHICTHKHTHAFWPCQVLAQSKCYISKIQMSNLVPQWLADDSDDDDDDDDDGDDDP